MELDRQITIMTEKAKQVKRKTSYIIKYIMTYNTNLYHIDISRQGNIYNFMLYESVSHKQSQSKHINTLFLGQKR